LARGVWPSDWEEHTTERLTIDAERNRLRVAVDGEPVALETPLEFSIQPRALRVLVPPG
jgi:diacylglycerol kinase family enzyme